MGKTLKAPDSDFIMLFGFDENGKKNALWMYGSIKGERLKDVCTQIIDELKGTIEQWESE